MNFHIDVVAPILWLIVITIIMVMLTLLANDVIVLGSSDRVKKTRISFERFQAMYAISPDKWDLGDHNVSYLLSDYGLLYSYYKDFAFSLRDRMRYRGFLREIKKKKKMAAETEEMERIIRSWQDDIEKYKETANMDIRNAVSWAQKAREVVTIDEAIDHAQETAKRLGYDGIKIISGVREIPYAACIPAGRTENEADG